MGKIIVFEGIDGSGKSTQFRALCAGLSQEGRDFQKIVFPQYREPSSALIRMYLQGEFGAHPSDVSPYAASTFYAVDRYASYRKVWGEYYQRGGLLIADRYTTSNAVHQGCKLPQGARAAFFEWLYDFEYRIMELPKPDAVFYMDIPLEYAVQNMRAREAETHTAADIHEADTSYLALCLECAGQAAAHYGWTKIPCVCGGRMRSVEEIAGDVRQLVRALGI